MRWHDSGDLDAMHGLAALDASHRAYADHQDPDDAVTDIVASDTASRAGALRQHTLRNPISCSGIGLHSGRRVTLSLQPAGIDAGIVFHRTDLGAAAGETGIPARFDHVVDTRFCTVVASRADARLRVGTIEHLMAALAGCGIDNARIEIDGPELPVLDGSAAPFMFLIDCAGRAEQAAPRRTIEVLKRVRVEEGLAFAEFHPSPAACLSLNLSIDFPARIIGRQSYGMILTRQAFRRELARCRTFTMLDEIEALREAGLARGGSLDNAIVVDDEAVLNPAGLRFGDEFVRHKMLDAVGDLSLGGHPIRASFVGHRSGHGLNNRLLRALFADPAAWRISGHGMAGVSSLAA